MTLATPDDIRRDLPPDLERAESEPLVALARRLQAETPLPTPTFRADLRRRLMGGPAGRRLGTLTPHFARTLAFWCVASGLVLLAVAAIGLAGTGPFAPG